MQEGDLVGIYMYSLSPVNYGMLIAEHERGSQHIRDIMMTASKSGGTTTARKNLQALMTWVCVDIDRTDVAN